MSDVIDQKEPLSGFGESHTDTISIADELKTSFRDYALSVIITRALPDVRDGLKPVHRRILYAMYREGLLSSKKFSKSAGVVGEVLKKYHPHGDSPVYDAMVRMAQSWNMRELLVEGQGNFGSVDGDPPAAYRYTEARLTKIAEELLRDIEKNTVGFVPNFDATVDEPTVLPAQVPNLLINGSEGIAVAMATRCPPHNLGEVIDALLAIIEEKYHEGVLIDDHALSKIIPGPDFPTGGIICGVKGCFDALQSGKGSIVLRGVAEVLESEKKNRKSQIIISEIPFQVNKARLLERIAGLVREKKIEGISEIRDESDRNGMQIAIDLKKDVVGEVVLNQLFQMTPLQTTYPVNMLSIIEGRPKTLGIRALLEAFLRFRREVVMRRSRFELEQAQKKFHMVSGWLTALDDIDHVVELIRSSKNTDEARDKLCATKFTGAVKIALFADAPTTQIERWLEAGFAQLDAEQAKAILEMRLSRLVALERDKLILEGEELLVEIKRLKAILADIKELMKVICGELRDIKHRFASPRRTQITSSAEDFSAEDLIQEEEMLVTISSMGYIKRTPLSMYRAQKRGGKGRSGAKAKEEDFIADAFAASTHAYLLIFTNFGKVHWVKVHRLPQAGPHSKGKPIINLIQLAEGEAVRAILPARHFPDSEGQQFVVTCSKLGKVKKTDLKAYSKPRASGLIACGIEEGDELIGVQITEGDSDILLSTRKGMAILFTETEARPLGRQAVGVKGIALRSGDEVVSMNVMLPESDILTVTKLGYGKRTPVGAYRKQSRGGLGLISIKLSNKNGEVADAVQVKSEDEVMLVTNAGTLIRVKASGVSEYGRNTQGVRLLSLNPLRSERVIAVMRIAEEQSEQPEEG